LPVLKTGWINSGGIFEVDTKEEYIRKLEEKTHQSDFWSNPPEAQKTIQELNTLKESLTPWYHLKKEFEELQTLLELQRDVGVHPEEEKILFSEIEDKIKSLEKDIRSLDFRLKLSQPEDKNNAIVTLHAGAGGTEACDWCEMLLRMYRRWAEKKTYKTVITDILPGDEAGIKSITFLIQGNYAYGYLKSEIGVHRLVRISPFDANKRRHTSFVSCDVIPEIEEEIRIEIKPEELRIDTFRASGHGGQHLQKTDSAVRITHLPTGLIVQCQNERSQYRNKTTALKILKARLYELEHEKKRAALEKHYNEKGEIAWGNQIRSYIFMPYQMVKDHRTGLETGKIDTVMDGELDQFIEAYLERQITK